MRVSFLALLLVAIAHSGSIGSGWRDVFGSDGKIGKKLESVKENIRKALERTGIFEVSNNLKALRNAVREKLKISKERMTALLTNLKKLRPLKRDHVKQQGDSIVEINQLNGVGEFLYQSDIVLTKAQAKQIESDVTGRRPKRQAYKDGLYPRTIWHDGVVYDFHRALSPKAKTVFLKAMNAWKKDTCLKFTKSSLGDHIEVKSTTGCWSSVGRVGGTQYLSIGSGCETVGNAAHELGHALGLYHTMSRHDRDEFVTIDERNIHPKFLDEFTKQSKDDNENYNVSYDYGSIMHYGATSGSKNNETVIVPNDPEYRETLGSAIISFADISVINEHYGCKRICQSKPSAECKNGGYAHPQDCSKCVCPSGYGGPVCSDRPDDKCGKTLEASADYKIIQSNMGDGQESDEFATCTYWIQAPQGKVVEVEIAEISGGLGVDGCVYGGVEIKAQKDQTLTGYRYCSSGDKNAFIKSKSSRLPIIFYNRSRQSSITLKYRSI